jgi:CheY-like chemotaxis protein
LEMPVMDGLTCVTKIRELQDRGDIIRHVPVIAVTANARQDQVQTYLKVGMVRTSPEEFQTWSAHFAPRAPLTLDARTML